MCGRLFKTFLSKPTFLNENAAAIAVATAGIALPLFTMLSKISINFPPASIAPLRKSDDKKSADNSSNFAFVWSIEY